MKIKLLLFVSILIICISCDNKKTGINKDEYNYIKKSIPDIHRNIVKNQTDSIKRYVKEFEPGMIQSKTGLWYDIYDNIDGLIISNGDEVVLNYTLSLLDGSVIYCSDSLGQKVFTVGRGGVEKGLEEAILLMNEGDKAKLILPPHLAYGLSGDMKRIPRLSILLYDIHIAKVTKLQDSY